MIAVLFSCFAILIMIVKIITKRNWLYLVSLFCVVFSAWLGKDFSPSYTASFYLAFIALTLVSEGVTFLPIVEPWKEMLSSFVMMLGGMFVYPASLIYLHGDNQNDFNTWASVVIGIVIFALFLLAFERKNGVKWTRIPTYFALISLMISGAISLLSGITSTALLPVGIGVALCTVSKITKNQILMLAGVLVTNIFLWAPMVF